MFFHCSNNRILFCPDLSGSLHPLPPRLLPTLQLPLGDAGRERRGAAPDQHLLHAEVQDLLRVTAGQGGGAGDEGKGQADHTSSDEGLRGIQVSTGRQCVSITFAF